LSSDPDRSKRQLPYPLKLKHQLGTRLFKRRAQRELIREVTRRVETGELIKLVVGAGSSTSMFGAPNSIYEGWILTDHATLNALEKSDWTKVFTAGTISRIFAEHVVEHWTADGLREFLGITGKYLVPGGNLRIAVPDGFHPDGGYIEEVKPGGTGPGSDDHRVLYNYQTLSKIFADENWEYDLLEYFDEHHEFHSKAWNKDNGFVERAEHTDPRNENSPLSYTSLILDAHPRS